MTRQATTGARPADRSLRGSSAPSASTRPNHSDPRLRGRRYAIPFERVWREAIRLISKPSRGWTVVDSDDQTGIIRAEARTLLLRFVDDVEIRVSLDADAQTRVDVTSMSRKGKLDFGTNARRIRRYLSKLDRGLGAGPEVILPPDEGTLSTHPQ